MLRRVNYRLRAEEARRSSEEPIVYGTAVAVGEPVACVTGVPVPPPLQAHMLALRERFSEADKAAFTPLPFEE